MSFIKNLTLGGISRDNISIRPQPHWNQLKKIHKYYYVQLQKYERNEKLNIA